MITMTWPQYQRRECQVGDFVLPLSPREAEVLLVLLMRYPRETELATLIGALWPLPDDEPEYAETSIYKAIMSLRRRLGAFRIVGHGRHGYMLVQRPADSLAA